MRVTCEGRKKQISCATVHLPVNRVNVKVPPSHVHNSFTMDLNAALQKSFEVTKKMADTQDGDTVSNAQFEIAHKGCTRLHNMLNGLSTVFPENNKLRAWILVFESTILGTPSSEVWAMNRWHEEMTRTSDGKLREVSLYDATRERDIETLLSSGVWVLDQIDARSMYYDPFISDSHRENMCCHFDAVNACSDLMSKLPVDMLNRVLSCVQTVDPTQPITPASMFSIMQKAMGSGEDDDTDPIERLNGWSKDILNMLQGDGLKNLINITGSDAAASATGIVDPTEMLRTMSGEIAGCMSLLTSASDGIENDQMRGMQNVLQNLGGLMGGFSRK